jgi:hypothetical protein
MLDLTSTPRLFQGVNFCTSKQQNALFQKLTLKLPAAAPEILIRYGVPQDTVNHANL